MGVWVCVVGWKLRGGEPRPLLDSRPETTQEVSRLPHRHPPLTRGPYRSTDPLYDVREKIYPVRYFLHLGFRTSPMTRESSGKGLGVEIGGWLNVFDEQDYLLSPPFETFLEVLTV